MPNYLPRVLPFGLFMSFIGTEELIRYLAEGNLLAVQAEVYFYLYPLKTLAVLAVILFFHKHYSEIIARDLLMLKNTFISAMAGVAVSILWINMDWGFATFGTMHGYNPGTINSAPARTALIFFRLAGASIVVPVMEELFWRSFLTRYLIAADFLNVPMGRYTPVSFALTTILFGLEHNLWLAGIMAGTIYNLILFRTRSITQCIMSHSVTNLILGIYVLTTERWYFW